MGVEQLFDRQLVPWRKPSEAASANHGTPPSLPNPCPTAIAHSLSVPIHLDQPAASLLNMEKDVAASLTSLFSEASNGRRLNAKEGEIVDKASNFLSSAIAALADASTAAIDKLETLSGKALKDGLATFTNEVQTENSWGDIIGNGQFIQQIKDADTLAEAQTVYETYEDAFCTPADYPGDFGLKIPTTCEGPTIRLEYEPKECVVSDDDHAITCQPGRLVLKKYPGKCTMKHHAPFEFKGKECVGSTIFYKKDFTPEEYGGEEYTLFFDQKDVTLGGLLHKAPTAE